MPLLEHLSLFLISLVANVLSAMAGGGAGLLQLPALIFLGLPLSMALATHKIATVALGLGATLKHVREGHLRWGFAALMLAAGLPGVLVGANIILSVPPAPAEFALGVLTLGLGVYSLFKKQLGQQYQPWHRDMTGYSVGALGLFLLGVLNGSLTSGTGLFVTVWLITWFGLDFKRATAYTMILVGLFWNGTGALALALQTPVKWAWLPALLLGSLVGGYVGAFLAIRYANPVIKRVFEVVTMAMGLALILQAVRALL
ncbi:sulfite exporter TauE/SafE family protein [Spongiibacter taiwanensis]|uniref:sulfite exporter TauE/SafE family protein n=1 Tax=Spongiibacter taiwanensis TaxID=1748242 RepID=UPI0020359A99|nr:sulfite exporter TauE/SafE family protein [Spongiibacter taiwanensis]USA42026.1 sulfite exporter TauE/SafE family protein [Spongiibacter taiwanensis]